MSTTQARDVPELLEEGEAAGEEFVEVACGSRHTVGLTASGRAFAWGWDKHGQCGGPPPAAAAAEEQVVRAPRPLRLEGASRVGRVFASRWATILVANTS